MKLTDKITLEYLDNIEFMKTKPDNCFSIGITDIPYGINVGNMAFIKENKTTVKQKNGTRINPNKNNKLKPADWDNETPREEWFKEFKRVTKEQIFFGVEYVDYEGLGSGRIKWNKGVPEGVSFKNYEMAYCSFIDYEKEIDYLWSGMMQGKSITNPMIQQGNKKLNEKRIHPTQKPVLLWDLILLFCQENGIDISSIFDSNMGLASLCLSSIKFNSSFAGCDLHKPYYDESIKRINNHIAQQRLF